MSEVKYYRDEINRLISRVPPKVNSGSIQLVRAWKDEATKARAAVLKAKATEVQLKAIYMGLSQYEQD